MSKYKLTYNTEYWECGDGCCDGEGYQLFINSIEIGCYADLSMRDIEILEKFVDEINKNDDFCIIVSSVRLDDEDELESVLNVNDVNLYDVEWSCEFFENILNKFNIKYRITKYDIDWDIWIKFKKLILREED